MLDICRQKKAKYGACRHLGAAANNNIDKIGIKGPIFKKSKMYSGQQLCETRRNSPLPPKLSVISLIVVLNTNQLRLDSPLAAIIAKFKDIRDHEFHVNLTSSSRVFYTENTLADLILWFKGATKFLKGHNKWLSKLEGRVGVPRHFIVSLTEYAPYNPICHVYNQESFCTTHQSVV